jgi:hypothetical protein
MATNETLTHDSHAILVELKGEAEPLGGSFELRVSVVHACIVPRSIWSRGMIDVGAPGLDGTAGIVLA